MEDPVGTAIVTAAARGIIVKEDRRLLAENGGSVIHAEEGMGTISTTSDGICEAPGDNQEQRVSC